MSSQSVANQTDRVKHRRTAGPYLFPVATVTFRSPSFIPESCLAAYDPTPVDDLRVDARATDLGRPSPAKGERLTCGEVYDWMYDHGLRVAKQNACRSSYHSGRWAGRYTLVLARAQEAQS